MRLVAVLTVAFVVLVGVVAVTYPNESDEVRTRNYMKLGDIKGDLKADPEKEEASFKPNILGLKQGDLLGISTDGTAKDDPDCLLKNILSWDCATWKKCIGDTADDFNRFRTFYPLVVYVTEGEDCY